MAMQCQDPQGVVDEKECKGYDPDDPEKDRSRRVIAFGVS